MKPRITFKCTNEECIQFDKEVELFYSSFFTTSIKEGRDEDYWNEFGWPDICHQLDNGDFECD